MDIQDHIQDLAKELVNNHAKFQSFWWRNETIEDKQNWAIINTSHRDSGLLGESNEKVFRKTLEKFENDVHFESHSHWAVGYVNALCIRVWNDDKVITEAFKEYCKLHIRLENYPVLDEDDFYQMEHEATWENVESQGQSYIKENPPENWVSLCMDWFDSNNQGAIEDRDDQGGYPSDDDMKECLEALGLLDPEYMESEDSEETEC